MASEFKELNNLYTKRPAVALFRKPFANNDEMSDILEGMLDIYASVEQQSISKYKAPKYKAIYWNHLSHNHRHLLFQKYHIIPLPRNYILHISHIFQKRKCLSH